MAPCRLSRRALLAAALLPGRPGLAAPGAAPGAEPWRGAISLLVGARPGTAGDQWARGFAPFLERHLMRVSVGVSNLPGEGGLAALRATASAAPDGHTIGLIATPVTLASAVERDATALLDAADPIAGVAEETLVLVVPPNAPAELAALRQPAEGAVLATPPAGSGGHLAAQSLREALPLSILAFASAAAARQAAQAGNVAAALVPLPDAIAALRDDRLGAAAIATPARSPLLPEVRTFKEQGVRFAFLAQRGVVAPPGLPDGMRGTLVAALQSVVGDPEFAAQADDNGFVPHFMPGAEWRGSMRQSLEELRARWRATPWIDRHG
ncbi:tripartite tricarboxylate transporter substrate-binding protein [Roseomonas sp. NAR14]|uniref:Tripartite tricarboxylate transporter substrate-binding protein n=1 Tax=Roseomonas acroporae TaxID=2937791 RepID=A0A9X2BTM7_9PROT|nr:tripartite tricarboxylate transporter substrate-binding protein [Roseomonas acroporae]MCK8784482.1 tripartite tricarboxylate transporter substrate-binding protein [Roseomonas acroporae]